MAAITIRNLPEATHRALKLLAARHGRSTEAEVRAIIELAVKPEQSMKIGTELAMHGRKIGGRLKFSRDRELPEPADFD